MDAVATVKLAELRLRLELADEVADRTRDPKLRAHACAVAADLLAQIQALSRARMVVAGPGINSTRDVAAPAREG